MNFIKHYTKLALFAAAVLMMSATSCNDKPAEAPKPAAKPEISDDFSLDDILAEFK